MHLKTGLLFALVLLCLSCGKDDGHGEAFPRETADNYFPINSNNEWIYDGFTVVQKTDSLKGKEILRLKDSVQENGTYSYQFTSNFPGPKKGFGTSLLTQGKHTKIEGRLIFNGNFGFYFPKIEESIVIPLRNLIIFDQNIDKGENLSTFNGTFNDTLNIAGEQLLTEFTYTLDMDAGEKFESYSNGIEAFDNVISSILTLNLSAEALLPDGSIEEILPEQNVLNSMIFFAEDVGMIFNSTTVRVKFEHLNGHPFYLTSPLNRQAAQALDDYTIK